MTQTAPRAAASQFFQIRRPAGGLAALALVGLVAGCGALPGTGTGIVTRQEAEARAASGEGASDVIADTVVTDPYAAAPVAQTQVTTLNAAPATAAGPATAPRGGSDLSRPAANTVAELDTTTPEERAAAAAAPEPAGEVRLGTTIASLGDPTESGFWLKTPLVDAKASGRVVNPANGKSAKVDLIPLAGPASGGSQLSLAAVQLLGIALTDLPEIEVYKN